MPRVVPRQIVDLIARTKVRGLRAPAMSAIVDLANELPDEFVVLSGDDYSDYRVSINTVLDLLDRWKSGRGNTQWVEECSTALDTIQYYLSKCPNEIPSPLTAELSFIPDVDLRNNIRNDISAATRALHDGLWKAATVLAGAAAEALLLWAITEKKTPAEIEATRAAVISGASRDPNDWVLDGYIKVARTLALIEDETEKQADIARGFRNFIHPGRSARLGKACDRGTALSALASVELIVRDLS